MNEIKYDEVTKLLLHSNLQSSNENAVIEQSVKDYFKSHVEKKAILGIDIYKYSKFKFHEQSLVPIVFKEIIKSTCSLLSVAEPTLFNNYKKNNGAFEIESIDTGDGGFFIFNNPLEAVVFNIYFHSTLHLYNSSNLIPDMTNFRQIIGEITIRYALTFDEIYKYENNYYGSAIITCARILSKDRLNRFLIDQNVVNWFSKKMNSVENLQSIRSEDLQTMDLFIDSQNLVSYFFSEHTNKICNVDLLKIGELTAKGDNIDIYNLCLKVFMLRRYIPVGTNQITKHTITIGNLNTSGID